MLTILKEFLITKKYSRNKKQLPISQIQFSEALNSKLKEIGTQSLSIREVDAGSSNDCEHEITALENPIYDFSRFGFKIVASPRHADILLVTGPVTLGMKTALIRTYEATPNPKIIIAVGDGAITGSIGIFTNKELCRVADCIPVDLEIPGNPPSPEEILSALLKLQGGN